MFRALLTSIKFTKGPTDALGFFNVILLHGNHRHVSATNVAIFRVLGTRIHIQL